ncbi:MAG: hypothetical protein QME25_06680 [Bacteroidota bacterium]|nr:hypothetical protein [Bacteroidota bacterium]
MLKLNSRIITMVAVVAFSASLFFMGCTSRPSEDELRQLNDLKAEVASLEKQIADKEEEKANLENEVAEKNAKLQQCQSDMDAVKKALGQ